jgi:hypothetical protein
LAFRFCWRCSSASLAARAAFCRARFSCLGTVRHHTGVSEVRRNDLAGRFKRAGRGR